jgi:glycine/D-amino acid oxidase-like deaminating enzyme
MQTEFLIIGQGISGTFVTWYLKKAGRSFIVIDNGNPASSSRVAAGIINPVTGRRIVQTWMIDILLPYALNAYKELGRELNIEAIAQKNIVDFFPSPQMVNAFHERYQENPEYLSLPSDPQAFSQYFNYDFGYGEISPAYAVNLAEIIPAWRQQLQIIEEDFDVSKLGIRDGGITYKDISAEKIIFCNGIAASEHPYFNKLPFALNKGQALIIRNKELPKENIFKKAMTIVPLKDDLFWVGSSYEWQFEDMYPSEEFLSRTTALLRSWIKSDFTVEAHLSSLRPATLERRPFVGLHPKYPEIGILNGMGTKGCSLAPYFAGQLVNYLINNEPILPMADIGRFRKILSS